jgi:hypothetical protein
MVEHAPAATSNILFALKMVLLVQDAPSCARFPDNSATSATPGLSCKRIASTSHFA